MEVDFVGGFYEDDVRGFDAQRCINWFPVASDSGNSKTRARLAKSPGSRLKSTATPNDGLGSRGMYETAAGRAFSAWGDTLFEFDSNGVLTDRNVGVRFARLNGNLSMADNGVQMIVIDEGAGYILTLASNDFTKISDAVFLANIAGANQVVFHDGYFIVSVPGTKRFYWSLDGVTWDALDFASMVSSPDNIISIIRTNTDVWLIGEKSIEPWQNISQGDIVFQRMPGAPQSIGTRNPWTVKKIGDVVYWLGSNKEGYGVVFRTRGYGKPQQVSTEAINQRVRSVGLTTDAYAYTYQDSGHYFYVLTIPSLNQTFVFDQLTSKWHERLFWDTETGKFEKHRSTHHTFAHGKNWVGFNGDNNLYHLDPDFYFDNAEHIRRIRRSAHQTQENHNVRYDKFELEFARGKGLVTGQGSAPKAFYRYSDDGANTWSDPDPRDMGTDGAYDTRATWRSQGTGRDRIHEIEVNDPFNADLIGAYMDVEVLNS